MLRNSFHDHRGQNTAEYALLIALVVAGIIAMQQYAQRALQARVRDAGTYLASTTNTIGTSVQYEPYYQQSNYEVTKDSVDTKTTNAETVAMDSSTNRVRSGDQTTTYDPTMKQGKGIMPSGI